MEDIIGKGWSFPPHFTKAGCVEMTSGTEEIEGSLAAIFSTRIGERLFRPDFGCDMEEYQFTPMDSSSASKLRRTIEKTVRKYEPRIDVVEVGLEGTDFQEGKLRISIKYTLKDSYDNDNIIYPFHYENNI
ncbi:MAG: GPW/gp25 family protein [Bacteroidales bacterium]|nr:GPW/gp25 family protein [Bacteroidales bacterium]MBR1434810.1 GPW/gp25 family protein [Bacteroidales bacterium]